MYPCSALTLCLQVCCNTELHVALFAGSFPGGWWLRVLGYQLKRCPVQVLEWAILCAAGKRKLLRHRGYCALWVWPPGVAVVADAVLCAGNVVHRSTCKPIQYHRPAGMLTGGCRCSLFALSRGVFVQIQQAQSDCVQDVNYIACPVCDYDALPTLEISLSVLVPGSAVTAPQTFVLTPQQYTCTNCGGNCQVMFQPVQGSYVGPFARALACLCHVSCRVVVCRSKQWILGDTFTEVCAP